VTNDLNATGSAGGLGPSGGDAARDVVRHILATLAYRASKAIRGAPQSYGSFRVGTTTRTPAEILAHMSDLMDWALTMVQGREQWHVRPPRGWADDVDRLFTAITALDRYLATGATIDPPALLQLVQGPVVDALTHTGQLTLLRRLADAPVRGEGYQVAPIVAGQTGLDQPPPVFEFD
jgi:hypothetical protein